MYCRNLGIFTIGIILSFCLFSVFLVYLVHNNMVPSTANGRYIEKHVNFWERSAKETFERIEILPALAARDRFCLPLPKLVSPTAPRVLFMRNGSIDPAKFDQAILFKLNAMIQTILMLEDDNYGVAGCLIVQDMKGVGMNHVLHSSPSLIKKAMYCFQHAFPNRVKGMYFFNIPSIFETINKLFKPFLTAKLQKRMTVYTESEIDSLYEFVPKEILPNEYGGDGGSIEEIKKYWKDKVESYREWFLDDAQYKTDENRRPGKPKTSESVFGLGIEGSFRQLAVD